MADSLSCLELILLRIFRKTLTIKTLMPSFIKQVCLFRLDKVMKKSILQRLGDQLKWQAMVFWIYFKCTCLRTVSWLFKLVLTHIKEQQNRFPISIAKVKFEMRFCWLNWLQFLISQERRTFGLQKCKAEHHNSNLCKLLLSVMCDIKVVLIKKKISLK